MDSKEIRELIEVISRSEFTTFELEREGFRLRLVRAEHAAAPPPSPRVAETVPAPVAEPAAAPPTAAAAPALAVPDGLIEIASPIVGTYYSAPGPDAEPFVRVGSKVAAGQVLCIVEAMKLMNEIEAERDGEIVEVLISNGQPVEYGETLFLMRPSG